MDPLNQQHETNPNQETEKDEDKSKIPPVKSSNWTSAEEELLATAWLHISQQPEFGTNQTGDNFFLQVANHLESISPFAKQDIRSVKIKYVILIFINPMNETDSFCYLLKMGLFEDCYDQVLWHHGSD